MSDAGAKALLDVLNPDQATLPYGGASAPPARRTVRRLKKLDIRHHFVSPGLVPALRATNVEVNADDPKEADEWGGEIHRFVSVSE